MTTRKVAISCDRASILLFEFFSKGAGGWDFCRVIDNYSEILMDLSTDYPKGVLEKVLGNSTVSEMCSLRFYGIYTLYHE